MHMNSLTHEKRIKFYNYLKVPLNELHKWMMNKVSNLSTEFSGFLALMNICMCPCARV